MRWLLVMGCFTMSGSVLPGTASQLNVATSQLLARHGRNDTESIFAFFREQLETIIDDTLQAHVADEQQLLNLAQLFTNCSNNFLSSGVNGTGLTAHLRTIIQEHDACRLQQNSTFHANESAYWAYQSFLYSDPENVSLTRCITSFLPDCPSALERIDFLDFENRDLLQSCLQRILEYADFYNETMAQLDDQLRNASAAHQAKVVECDVKQSRVESAFCQYAINLTVTCNELDQCYNTAQTIFEQDLQLKREAAQTQNATYLSATAMLCVLDGNSEEFCRSQTVDTTALQLELPVIADKDACDPSIVAEKPCANAWVNEYYVQKNWYSTHVLPAQCTQCQV